MAITTFSSNDAINEQSTARYACTFVDHIGVAIDSSAISAIVATLKNASDDTTINSRAAQSVLNAHGGTMGSGGAFALILSTLDTVAVGALALQPRRLTLVVDYTDGRLTHEVDFLIRALQDVS